MDNKTEQKQYAQIYRCRGIKIVTPVVKSANCVGCQVNPWQWVINNKQVWSLVLWPSPKNCCLEKFAHSFMPRYTTIFQYANTKIRIKLLNGIHFARHITRATTSRHTGNVTIQVLIIEAMFCAISMSIYDVQRDRKLDITCVFPCTKSYRVNNWSDTVQTSLYD